MVLTLDVGTSSSDDEWPSTNSKKRGKVPKRATHKKARGSEAKVQFNGTRSHAKFKFRCH